MRREYLEARLARQLAPGDWPTLGDLQEGRVAVEPSLLAAMEAKLRSVRHCFVTAPEGRGKTTLVRLLGYQRYKDKQTVVHYDLSEPGGDSVDEVCETIRALDHAHPLYIFENLQDVDDAASLNQLLSTAGSAHNSFFLWTTRDIAGRWLNHLQLVVGGHEVSADAVEVRLRPSRETIRRIIADYVRTTTAHRLVVPSESEVDDILARVGGNLRILAAYLDTWVEGPFASIPEEGMLRAIYARRIAPLRSGLRLTLVKLSAINQFGIGALGRAFEEKHAEELEACGLLGSLQVLLDMYYMSAHSSDARVNLRAWAFVNSQNDSAITLDVLRTYLSREPLPWGHRLLFQRLRSQGTLLSQLLNDERVRQSFVHSFEKALEAAPVTFVRNTMDVVTGSPLATAAILKVTKSKGPEFWTSKLRARADQDEADWTLKFLAEQDEALSKAVRNELSAEDWKQIWLRLPLRRLIGFLYRYADQPLVHAHTQLARAVLEDLPNEPQFRERLSHLSYELVGKLLLICRKLSATSFRVVGLWASERLDLTGCHEGVKLTLIMKELWEAGEVELHNGLLARIMRSVPGDVYSADPSGRAIMFLLLHLVRAVGSDRTMASQARTYLEATLTLGVAEQAVRWNSEVFGYVLAHGELVDATLTKHWLGAVPDTGIENLVIQSSGRAAFFVLLHVWQLDDARGHLVMQACLAHHLSAEHWLPGTVIDAEGLPLLGLYATLLGSTVGVILPDPREAAAALVERPIQSALVFALAAYGAFARQQARHFGSALATLLIEKGVTTNPRAYLTAHSREDVRRLMAEILDRYPIGPDEAEAKSPS
jgi:hypothetical protein